MAGQVMLVAQGVATVVLPWWPDEMERTNMGRSWIEVERPGRRPLLLTDGLLLDQYAVGCVIRDGHPTIKNVSVPALISDLNKIAKSKTPVDMVTAGNARGLFHLTELSVVELETGPQGYPTVADVSFTLKRASDATVKVGPIPRKRNRVPKRMRGKTYTETGMAG